MKKLDIKMISKLSIVAALYVALTLGLAPISYGAIQFRISEALMILIFFAPEYGISLALGCFISNAAGSSIGWPDMVFGTLATVLSVLMMLVTKKHKFISTLWPVVINGLIIGAELHFVFEIPFWITAAQVALGEFIVVSLIGYSIFKTINANQGFLDAIGFKHQEAEVLNDKIKPSLFISLTYLFLGLACFIGLPIWTAGAGDNATPISLFNLTFGQDTPFAPQYYFIVLLIASILVFVVNLLLKERLNAIFNIILAVVMVFFITAAISKYNYMNIDYSFYFYYLLALVPTIVSIFKLKKKSKVQA